MTISWACSTWWSNFYSFTMTSIALHSNHHDTLSHRHESCSLTSSAFLRFCARTRFWSLTGTTIADFIVFDCLNFSQKYFFYAVYSIFKVNVKFDCKILSLMRFLLLTLSLALKRASKDVFKNILKVHVLRSPSTSSSSEPIGRVKILKHIFFRESSLILISGSSLVIVSPFRVVWQYFVCTGIKIKILIDLRKLVFGISGCTFIRVMFLSEFIISLFDLIWCSIFGDTKGFFDSEFLYSKGLSFWKQNKKGSWGKRWEWFLWDFWYSWVSRIKKNDFRRTILFNIRH